ncbi:MAG: hypothetical protein WC558_10120 [Patulibacter sp.]
MPSPSPASTFQRRSARSGLIAGGMALALVLSACGGDDDSEPTTTAAAPPVSTEAAPAAEAPDANLAVKLTPERVGTEDRPQAVRIAVDLRMEPPAEDAEVAPVQTVTLTIPDGVAFRPDDLKACEEQTLADEGPSGCPDASQFGRGTVSARAGTIQVEGQATAVYGGDDRVLLWVAIANPVSVGAAIEGKLEEQPEGGYRLALEVPADLQDVAGLPVALDRLRVTLGRGDALATTACPDRGLPFFAQLTLAGDTVVPAATTADCR